MEMSDRVVHVELDTLQGVLNNLVDGLVVIDRNGNFLYINKEARRIIGPGPQKVDPARWTDHYQCFYPDRVTPYPLDRLPLYRALHGEEVDNELIYIRNLHESTSVWISASGRAMKNGDGSIWGGMVMIRDVTELQRAEDRLHLTSSRFSAIIENQQTGILVESEKRRVLEVNQPFCDLFDIPVSPADLIGADCVQAAEQAKTLFGNPEEFLNRVDTILQERSIVTNEELALADGRVFERDYIPVFVNKVYRGGLWQYRNITSRLKARENIKVFERLCSALEQTADSVVITDRHGCIEYVNSGFEITTGYARDEVLGKTPRLLKSGMHDEEFYKNLWQRLMTGHPFKGTIINRKKSGELYWSQQTITPVTDDRGQITHYVSVLKDITDLLKRQEQEVEMRVAHAVQQRFYHTSANVPGYDIAGSSYPATETGGDYFDFITLPDGSLAIAIGDVSGHGIGPALVMAEMRAYLRAFAATGMEIHEIMTQLNRALEADLDGGRFVTLFLARLDPRKRELAYVSAGHIPGYLLNGSGKLHLTMESTAPPLGILPDYEFPAPDKMPLRTGQILLLTTDGIIDSMAEEDMECGMTRAIKFTGEHRGNSAREIVDGLYRATRSCELNQTQEDDATLVVLKAAEDNALP